MFRHSPAIVVSLLTLLGALPPAPAQTPLAGSPPTAYRQHGKWVGYVPTYQKFSQSGDGPVFRSSVPDVATCLARKPDPQVKTAAAVESVDEPQTPFEGALLDSSDSAEQPQVLPTAYDEPTLAFDPATETAPEFDPAVEMVEEGLSGECEPCAAAPHACCPPPRFYGGAEYLLWWTDGMGTPPLVTTSPFETGREEAGVLGQPGTTILFGGSDFDDNSRSGVRASLGLWLDPCQNRGLEASYFTLGTYTTTFAASDADYSILGRPFYNTTDGQQNARLIAYDELVSGTVAVNASTDFEGGEFLFRQSAQKGCWAEIDLLVGYRWLQLEDGLLVQETTQSFSAAAPGTTVDLFDRFDTSNRFHGGEVGVAIRSQISCCWSLEVLGKIGIGNVNSVVTIDGQRTTVAPTGTSITEGGLLAQPTNMGRYERDKIAAASELGIKLKRAFGNGIDLSVGYTFLYLSDVVRAGEQIDPNINDSQFPPSTLVGAAFPEFRFQSNGFWAQGLSVGIEGRF